MPNTVTATGATPAPKSLPARFLGIITSPAITYRAVAAHPRWFGMLALTTILAAFFTALPLTTADGRAAALEQQVQGMKSLGITVSDEMYDKMEQCSGRKPYTTAASIIVIGPIMALIITGVVFVVFNAAMGGEASFKQVFAVVVHAGVISSLSAVFSGVINYFRGGMASAANLGALLPMLPEDSFAGRLLGTIDVFLVWWVIVLAIGIAVLYRRRTQWIAISLLGVYAVIALIIAVVKSRLGGA
jgi:hypothetical protein